jgi:hypothetical protein
MKKIAPIIFSLFILVILFVPVADVFAQPQEIYPGGPTGLVPDCNKGDLIPVRGSDGVVRYEFENPCGICHITELVQRVINFFIYFAVVVATLMFTYAGFLYLTAGGKEDQISKAHKVFWNVFLGLIFVLVAWLVVDTIMKIFVDEDGRFGRPWQTIKCDKSSPTSQPTASQSPQAPSSSIVVNPPSREPTEAEKLEAKYRADYEAFRKIVEEEGTKEKLTYLEQTFGGAIDSFLQSHAIESDLRKLDGVSSRLNEKDTFIRENSPELTTFGSIVSNAYENRWVVDDSTRPKFSVEGLEHIQGLSNEGFQAILDNKYPELYLTNSLSGVVFDPNPRVEGNFIVLGEAEGFNIFETSSEDVRRPITIYNTPDGMSADKFIEIFEHEINHTSDWNNSMLLNPAERVSMLYDISQRIDANDRFRSGYVERIDVDQAIRRYPGDELPSNIAPEQLHRLVQTNEYWPEIAKEYFHDPQGFKNAYPKDAALVEKWVNRTIE